MKRTAFFIMLVIALSSTSVFAAWKTQERSPLTFTIDCYGGYGFIFSDDSNELNLFGDEDNEVSYGNFKDGWHAGVQMGLTFPNQMIMKFQPFIGFQYYRRNLSVKVVDTKTSSGWDNDDDLFEARYSMSLSFIDITCGCRIFISWFYFEAGIFGGIEIPGLRQTSSVSASGSFNKDEVERMLDGEDDMGLLFGIGCAFPLHDHITLNIGCRVQTGFLTSSRMKDEVETGMMSISLYGGIGFKIF